MTESYIDTLKRVRSRIYGSIKIRERNEFVDCCEEFKFIRDFDTYNFNQKMNAEGITDLVLKDEKGKRYNLYKIVYNSIINPIKYKSNVVIGIIGETGSGKSELAQALSLISKYANKKYKNRNVKIHLCWTSEDLFNALKKLKKGDVIMKDESPRAFEEGANIEKWSIENALAVIRKMENTLIFCHPKDIRINLCDMYLETAGMNLKTRTNRFMVLNKERMYFGHFYTKLHNDTEFRDMYEKEKAVFVKKTIEIAGKFLSGLRKDKGKKKVIDAEFTKDKQKLVVGKYPLRSIEHLKEQLKGTKNEITVKEYSKIIKESIEIARRTLNNFVKDKEFDYVQRGKTKVYYSKK